MNFIHWLIKLCTEFLKLVKHYWDKIFIVLMWYRIALSTENLINIDIYLCTQVMAYYKAYNIYFEAEKSVSFEDIGGWG